MAPLTCPNCGNGFPDLRDATRMFDCDACGTTLFRDPAGLRAGAQRGEMGEAEMLVRLGSRIDLAGGPFEAVGHARFEYGRGWWDEFWAEGPGGDGLWLSVDEGDVVAQRAVPRARWPQTAARRLGATVAFDGFTWTVTEIETARCTAIRGQFPEALNIGERHSFINLSGPSGRVLSGEFWDDDEDAPGAGVAWFEGEWLDPFALKVSAA